MSKPRNGWRSAAQRKGRPPAELPNVPPQIEVLLASMGLTEAQAASNEFVRSWVRQNKDSKYVSTGLLEAVCGRQY